MKMLGLEIYLDRLHPYLFNINRVIFSVFLVYISLMIIQYKKEIISYLKGRLFQIFCISGLSVFTGIYAYIFVPKGFGHVYGEGFLSLLTIYMDGLRDRLIHHGFTSEIIYSTLGILRLPYYSAYVLNFLFFIGSAFLLYHFIETVTRKRYLALFSAVLFLLNPIFLRYAPTEIFLHHYFFFSILSLVLVRHYFAIHDERLKFLSILSLGFAFTSGSYGFTAVIPFVLFSVLFYRQYVIEELTKKSTYFFGFFFITQTIFQVFALWEREKILQDSFQQNTTNWLKDISIKNIITNNHLFNNTLFSSDLPIILFVVGIVIGVIMLAYRCLKLSGTRRLFIFSLLAFMMTSFIIHLHKAGEYHNIYETAYSTIWITPILCLPFILLDKIKVNRMVRMLVVVLIISSAIGFHVLYNEYVSYQHLDYKTNMLMLDFLIEHENKTILMHEHVHGLLRLMLYEHQEEKLNAFLGRYGEQVLANNNSLILYNNSFNILESPKESVLYRNIVSTCIGPPQE